jgi:hypothetical protein
MYQPEEPGSAPSQEFLLAPEAEPAPRESNSFLFAFFNSPNKLLTQLRIWRVCLFGKGRQSKADRRRNNGKYEANLHCLLWEVSILYCLMTATSPLVLAIPSPSVGQRRLAASEFYRYVDRHGLDIPLYRDDGLRRDSL